MKDMMLMVTKEELEFLKKKVVDMATHVQDEEDMGMTPEQLITLAAKLIEASNKEKLKIEI